MRQKTDRKTESGGNNSSGEHFTGFASPAEDQVNAPIDLNKELIHHPETTYFARIDGDALKDIGIQDGDLIVIDRSLPFQENDLVVCYLNGAFDIKFVHYTKDGEIYLTSSDPERGIFRASETDDLLLWGVITYVIHQYNRR